MSWDFWKFADEDAYRKRQSDLFKEQADKIRQQMDDRWNAGAAFLDNARKTWEQTSRLFDVTPPSPPSLPDIGQAAGSAAGSAVEHIGRGLTFYDQNVAKPVKGIATSAVAAPFEATASKALELLGGPAMSEKSTTLSEILAPRLMGATSAEEAWQQFGKVGDWQHGPMAETRDNLPAALRVPLEGAGLASEIANPAYGPMGISRGPAAGAKPVGQADAFEAVRMPGAEKVLRAGEVVQAGVDPLGWAAGQVIGIALRKSGGLVDRLQQTGQELAERYPFGATVRASGDAGEMGRSMREADLRNAEARMAELRAKHPHVTDEDAAATPLGRQIAQYRQEIADFDAGLTTSIGGPRVTAPETLPAGRLDDDEIEFLIREAQREHEAFPSAMDGPQTRTPGSWVQDASRQIEKAETFSLPVDSIRVDPERFQFRDLRKADAAGTTGKYRGATKFVQTEAAPIKVWRDPSDGELYLVDGHHRLDIARRDPSTASIQAVEIFAEDAEQARILGALSNMLAGTADPADAAVVLKRTGLTAEDLADYGISLTNRETERALDLAKLDEGLLNQVRNGMLPIDTGAHIGRVLGHNPDLQRTAAQVIAARDDMKPDEVRRLINRVAQTGTYRSTQSTLFGSDDVFGNTFAEEAQLESWVARQLKREAADFGRVGQEGVAARLSAEGNVLNTERNREIAQAARTDYDLFELRANHIGPVNDAIKRAALEVAGGANEREVRQRLLEEIRRIVRDPATGDQGTLALGAEAPSSRGRTFAEAAAEDDAARTVEPDLPGMSGPGLFDGFGLGGATPAPTPTPGSAGVPTTGPSGRPSVSAAMAASGGTPPSGGPPATMGSADSPPPSGPAGALADAYRTMFRNPPTVGAPKPTWRDRLREFSLTLREGITDDLVRVKEATDPGGKPLAGREDLYKRLTREAGMLGRQEAAVADTVDQITRAAGGPDRMTPDLWEDAGVLLTLYRNIDRAQRGFKNPLGDRLPAADDVTALQREIAAFERHLRDKGTLPQVQQVMQVVRETGNRMLDEQQRVGNLSAEQVKAIRSQNNYWAPYGVLEHLAERDGPLPTPRGYDRLTSGIRRLVGTSKEIDNPLQTLLERVADHTARIERKEILNDTLATFRDYLTEIKPKVRPVVTVGETEANRLLAEATGKGTATVYRPQGVQQGVRDGVLHVLEDGTWKAYQVAPEAHWLENILKANNHEALNTVTRLARWAGTPLRMGATILNPDFLAANLSADLFQAYVVRGLMPFGPSWWRGFAAELGLQHVPGNKQLAGVVGKVFGSDPTLARSWLREGGAHSGIMTEVSRDSLKGMIDRQMPVARTAAIRALMQAGGGSVVGGTAGAVTAPEDQRLERALLGFGAGAVGGRLAGRMTGRTFATVQDAAKALPPEAGQSFLDVVIRPLMTAGQIVEGTTRLGVFDKMLRQGASPAEAALASRSATVDFSRGGTWSKNINHAIPFFNAALQGNRVLLNALKNDRTIPLVKEALTGKRSLASVLNDEKAAGLRMATLATAAAGVWWWNHRNEEIAKLNRDVPEYVKDSELYFVVGKHVDEFGRERPEYLRVPQRTVKLLTTPVERLLDYSYQKGDRTIVETLSRLFNPENAVETAGTTLGSLARIGPRMLPVQNMTDAAPTVLNTAQELTSNWDTFRGREIEPLELTDKRPSERVLPTTSGVAQGISRLAGAFGQEWSPVKVDYAIRNTGAGGARYATDALDAAGRVAGLMPEKPARDLPNPEATDSPEARLARTPIVRRFLSVSGGGETKERKEAVEKAHGPETYAQMREAGRAAAKRFAALSQEQAQLDARLAQGLISGPEWREQRKTLNTRRQEIFATLAEAFPAIPADEAGRRGYAQLLATIGGQVPDSRDRAVVLAETYRAIEAPELPNGQPDFHTIEREQATFKSTLSAEDRTALEERLNQHKTPGERVYAEAVDQLKAYNTIPRYRGMSVEEGNAVNDLVVEARAVSRATGRPLQTVIRQIGREDPDKRTLLPKALRVMRNPRQMANPDRTKFWQAHPLLFSFFSEIPFDLALEQESARELASLGNLMGAGA